MPRTKAVRSKKQSERSVQQEPEPESSSQSSNDLIDIWLAQFEKDVASTLLNFDNKCALMMEQIDQVATDEMSLFPPSMLKKTMKELRAEKSFSALSMKSVMFETASMLKHFNTTTDTTFTVPVKKKQIDDEGYLTACESGASATGDSSRSRPRSSSATRKGREAKREGRTRVSRSLSRSQMPTKNVTIQAPEKVTPEKRMRPPMAFGMVTPKVKPNMPVSVYRRPIQGEMALSMQGSPLFVSGVVTDSCANVNIPLTDGRVISLQPSRGLRMSEIPELDENTRLQLAQLRDNLNKVVELTYDN